MFFVVFFHSCYLKKRYNYQTLYNASLRRQVKKMRGEVRLLRNGVALAQVSADMDRMSTAGCRQHVKHLKTELLSLKGKATQQRTRSSQKNIVSFNLTGRMSTILQI